MSSTPDVVILNTSPLLYLYQVNQLELLPKLYSTLATTAAVQKELEAGKERGVDVPDVQNLSWLTIKNVSIPLAIHNTIDLGRGEAEVIALGLETENSLLVLDDQLGRRIAKLYQLTYTGTLGILIKAKQAGHLSAILPVIAGLEQRGMWLTQPVIQMALKLAQE